MKLRRVAVGLATSALLMNIFAGCREGGLEVPSASTNIAKCATRMTPYPVTEIPKHAPVACDLGGQQLILPNGFVTEAPYQGDNEGISGGDQPGVPPDDQYSLLDFGTFGMVVGQLDPHTCKTTWWGTKEGLERFWAAFGKKMQSDDGNECPGND